MREHAVGKARSVHRPGQVTLGVDTTVHLDGASTASRATRSTRGAMLRELAGRTHVVLSGVCLLERRGRGRSSTRRRASLPAARRAASSTRYIASGEWEGRAGGYAIQGLGGRLVERVEGDYLNVVGLPGALLVDLLERRAPGLLS